MQVQEPCVGVDKWFLRAVCHVEVCPGRCRSKRKGDTLHGTATAPDKGKTLCSSSLASVTRIVSNALLLNSVYVEANGERVVPLLKTREKFYSIYRFTFDTSLVARQRIYFFNDSPNVHYSTSETMTTTTTTNFLFLRRPIFYGVKILYCCLL